MTVVFQRRDRGPGSNAGSHLAYEYDRAYRLSSSFVAVELVNGPSDNAEGWVREFMEWSVDELLYERVELVDRGTMLADLGAEIEGGGPTDPITRYV